MKLRKSQRMTKIELLLYAMINEINSLKIIINVI